MERLLVMIDVHQLPALNAALNATSALLLVAGYLAIRGRRIGLHATCMALAFLTSTVFLVSYLVYHARVGSVRFKGLASLRTPYLALLASHTLLAMVNVPLAIATLSRALRRRFQAHARLARVTLPIWLYVSITGVIVYWMLYRL